MQAGKQEDPFCSASSSVFAPYHPGRLSQPSECHAVAEQMLASSLLTLFLLVWFSFSPHLPTLLLQPARQCLEMNEWEERIIEGWDNWHHRRHLPASREEPECLCNPLPSRISVAFIWKGKEHRVPATDIDRRQRGRLGLLSCHLSFRLWCPG